MAKATPDTDTTIEGLLQQRAQYEQWLARLDSAGDKAPAAVRAEGARRLRGAAPRRDRAAARPRGDDQRGARAAQASRRPGWTASAGRPRRRWPRRRCATRSASTPRTSGAQISDESNEHAGPLRGELREGGDEIARLAEVQGLIGGAPEAGRAAARRRPPAPRRRRRRPRRCAGARPAAGTRARRRRRHHRRPPRPRRRTPEPPTPAAARRPTGRRRSTSWRSSSRWPEEERKPAPASTARRGSNPGGRRPRPGRCAGGREPAAAPGKAGRAPAWPRRSSAASAARSTGRRSGTASAVGRSWPASDCSVTIGTGVGRDFKSIGSGSRRKGPRHRGALSPFTARRGYFLPPPSPAWPAGSCAAPRRWDGSGASGPRDRAACTASS